VINLTQSLTGRFLHCNYVQADALRRPAFVDVSSSLNLAPDWRGRGRLLASGAPLSPQKKLSPSDRGIATRGRVTDSVASAVYCLHRISAVSQPLLTPKCASDQ
jgi:hypothetical protein